MRPTHSCFALHAFCIEKQSNALFTLSIVATLRTVLLVRWHFTSSTSTISQALLAQLFVGNIIHVGLTPSLSLTSRSVIFPS